MKRRSPASRWIRLGLVSGCTLVGCVARAATQDASSLAPAPSAWLFEVDLGGGALRESFGRTPGDTRGVLNARLMLGHSVSNTVSAGLSLGGSGTGSSGRAIDPNTGVSYGPEYSGGWGVERLFAFTRLRPDSDGRWFLELGAGPVRFWSTRQGESGGSGAGFQLGVGREFPLGNFGPRYSIATVLALDGGWIGRAGTPAGIEQSLTYRSVSFSVGVIHRW